MLPHWTNWATLMNTITVLKQDRQNQLLWDSTELHPKFSAKLITRLRTYWNMASLYLQPLLMLALWLWLKRRIIPTGSPLTTEPSTNRLYPKIFLCPVWAIFLTKLLKPSPSIFQRWICNLDSGKFLFTLMINIRPHLLPGTPNINFVEWALASEMLPRPFNRSHLQCWKTFLANVLLYMLTTSWCSVLTWKRICRICRKSSTG